MSDNRTILMNTALRLFADYGYDAVGVQQIVEAAGVTKPTLYHYFHSKLGLFETLVAERSAPLLAQVAEATAYGGDVTGAITRTVRAFFDFAAQEPVFYRVLITAWYAPPGSEHAVCIVRVLRQLYDAVQTMFEQAGLQHGNMRGRQRRYAISLRGTIDTYIGLSFQDYVDLRDERLIYELVHQFMHGIFS